MSFIYLKKHGMLSFQIIFSQKIHYDKNDKFLKYFVKKIPKEIKEKIFCIIKNKKKECAKRFSL